MSYAAEEITTGSFDVVIGTKRQLTIPTELFRQLGLKAGDPLRLTLNGETVRMEPMVSIPRSELSAERMAQLRSRMGMKADDVTAGEIQAYRRKAKRARPSSADGLDGRVVHPAVDIRLK